jgi:general secretion pathway protein D
VRFIKFVALVLALGLLQACAANLPTDNLLEKKLESKRGSSSQSSKRARLEQFLASRNAEAETPPGFAKIGNDRLIGAPIAQTSRFVDDKPQEITLNLVNVPIPQAAKSVMGDILEINYTVDARVAGNVTLQTSKPISKRQLLAMFEASLRDNNAAIVEGAGAYRIVPLEEAIRVLTPMETTPGEPDRPGVRPQMIVLRYVGAEDMRDVIAPMIPEGMLLNVDTKRNALILSGTTQEIAAIRETISIFDVDWMKGMSFALVPVKSSSPEDLVNDLESVFQTRSGPLKGIVRFIPNKRLKSVLVISSRSKYLADAAKWIRKLDALAESTRQNLHVYKVQNRTATDVAKVLQAVFQAKEGRQVAVEAGVAPKLASADTSLPEIGSQQPQPAPQTQEQTGGPETPIGGVDSTPGTEPQPQSAAPVTAEGQGDQAAIRVVADDSNNALLVFSTDADYRRVLDVLEEIDAIPNQVLIEAVIAEVTLDDDLRFGVRWFFGDGQNTGIFGDVGVNSAGNILKNFVRPFSGFSYILRASDIAFSLQALAAVTDVRVLSSPSLVVLDNKTAKLQVGDQVPFPVNEQSTGIGRDLITSFEQKDTGVILSVTPRINDSGRVTLDIEQEVSAAVPTTSSTTTDAPTIQQRKIKTSVVISDGESLALGGLIQEREETTKSKVPVFGDIPLLGNAFRQKRNFIKRTELLIFIRPRVIRSTEEARRVTDEFRKQLGVQAPRVRRIEPTPESEINRIFN